METERVIAKRAATTLNCGDNPRQDITTSDGTQLWVWRSVEALKNVTAISRFVRMSSAPILTWTPERS
jgi:hypothetical protein